MGPGNCLGKNQNTEAGQCCMVQQDIGGNNESCGWGVNVVECQRLKEGRLQ